MKKGTRRLQFASPPPRVPDRVDRSPKTGAGTATGFELTKPTLCKKKPKRQTAGFEHQKSGRCRAKTAKTTTQLALVG